ncbi:MAG TPA: hypothetical protein VF240_05605 [Pyrinomonadaceae bacterium]
MTTNHMDAARHPGHGAEVERLYRDIAVETRYGHYVRIPERICRCLDYFGVRHERAAVAERLHSYYLFIGVVDDAIDASRAGAGESVLKRLEASAPSFDEETRRTRTGLLTEVLKTHIGPEVYTPARRKLEELYGAVVGERGAGTLGAYIERRKTVGRLTTEVSYLLIAPLLEGGRDGLLGFLRRVGEVGCLVDSVVDLRADERAGLLGFRPTARDRLRLAGLTVYEGLRMWSEHPRLTRLFLEAVGDVLLDRLRARRPQPAADGRAQLEVEY